RWQAGRWTELSPADRNAAWTPPPAAERAAAVVDAPQSAMGARARMAWLGLGAVALAVLVAGTLTSHVGRLTVTRADAEGAARRALADRGATLDRKWRVLPMPLDGSEGPHEFVSETAGEARRRNCSGNTCRCRAGRF